MRAPPVLPASRPQFLSSFPRQSGLLSHFGSLRSISTHTLFTRTCLTSESLSPRQSRSFPAFSAQSFAGGRHGPVGVIGRRISIRLLHHHAGRWSNRRVPDDAHAITPVPSVFHIAGDLYTCYRRHGEAVAPAGAKRVAVRIARRDNECAMPAIRLIRDVYEIRHPIAWGQSPAPREPTRMPRAWRCIPRRTSPRP